MMRTQGLPLLALALLVVGVVTGPGAYAQREAAPGATTARQAVAILVSSVTSRHFMRANCHPYSGPSPVAGISGCPVTTGLRAALLRQRYNAICRCENPPRQVVVLPPAQTSAGVFVEAYFDYGPDSFVTTYKVVKGRDGWLVSDMYCVRHPETSVFGRNGASPCP